MRESFSFEEACLLLPCLFGMNGQKRAKLQKQLSRRRYDWKVSSSLMTIWKPGFNEKPILFTLKKTNIFDFCDCNVEMENNMYKRVPYKHEALMGM